METFRQGRSARGSGELCEELRGGSRVLTLPGSKGIAVLLNDRQPRLGHIYPKHVAGCGRGHFRKAHVAEDADAIWCPASGMNARNHNTSLTEAHQHPEQPRQEMA